MTPRDPSAVSAARLREIRTLEEAYSAVERLTRERDEATARANQWRRADQISHERAEKAERELSEAQRERDEVITNGNDRIDELNSELSEARLALIPLQVDKAAAEKMAIDTGRELAEARTALAKAEEGLVTLDVAFTASEGARVAVATERDQAMRERDLLRTCGIIEVAIRNPNVASYCEHWEGRTEKAEASCREHAEAIVVLRDALRDLKVVAADNLPSVVARRSARVQDALQKAIKKATDTMRAPIPAALASRLSAEREKERAVVRAARKIADYAPLDDSDHGYKVDHAELVEAVFALPEYKL
jgi:hypothetical protein